MSDGFRYDGRVAVRYGRGAAAALSEEVARVGERAFVVTGETVGATRAVMEPIREGLGDRLAGVYANAGTDMRVSRACAAAKQARAADADVLVSVGGGSAVSLTRSVRIVHARGISAPEAAREVIADGTLRVPERPTPTIAVPTTLAGAAISKGAGVSAARATAADGETTDGESNDTADGGDSAASGTTTDGGDSAASGTATDGELTQAVVADWSLAPQAAVFDPALFEPTPPDVLAASAMNGFNKGIETLYAANTTPITDATARDGLRYFLSGIESLRASEPEPAALDRAVLGGAMVRFGTIGPDSHTLSVIHAFGHALLADYDVHLGRVHAAVAPAVLRDLFDRTDGRRAVLADALAPAVDGPDDCDASDGGRHGSDRETGAVGWFEDGSVTGGEASSENAATSPGQNTTPDEARTDRETVLAAVTTVRETLGLPTRLRDLSDPPAPSELSDVAEAVITDPFVENAPPGYDPTVEEITAVLRDAY